MRKFIVEQSFWDLFPEAKLGIVVAKGINNNKTGVDFEPLLDEAGTQAVKAIGDTEFSQHPAISVWRNAYKRFKTPKGNRSSIEALAKRVYNGKKIGSINPL